MRSMLNLRGQVRVSKNNLIVYEGRNLITTVGFAVLADLMAGNGGYDAVSHIAMGDDGTAPTLADTDLLGTEVERVSAALTLLDASIKYTATFPEATRASPELIKEFGLFNHASAGEMIARFVSPDIEVAVEDELDVEWTINLTPDLEE